MINYLRKDISKLKKENESLNEISQPNIKLYDQIQTKNNEIQNLKKEINKLKIENNNNKFAEKIIDSYKKKEIMLRDTINRYNEKNNSLRSEINKYKINRI